MDKLLITVAYASVLDKGFVPRHKFSKTLQCDGVFRLLKNLSSVSPVWLVVSLTVLLLAWSLSLRGRPAPVPYSLHFLMDLQNSRECLGTWRSFLYISIHTFLESFL